MKVIPAAVKTILDSQHYWASDCYTITLQSGFVARYTSADFDLTDSLTGHVFSSQGPLFDRSLVKQKVGIEVDDMTIKVSARSTDLINGEPFIWAIRTGQLDYGTIQLDRSYRATLYGTSAGLVTVFTGLIAGSSEVSRLQATLTVKSHLDLLNQNMPPDVFQTGCRYTLYDVNCTLSKAALQIGPVSVQSVPDLNTVVFNYSAAGTGAFSLGSMTFTTGVLAGQSFTIKQSTLFLGTTVVSTVIPLPQAPSPLDLATIAPGCDKTQSTCSTKFSNLANFGGFPNIPIPETAV